MKVAFTTSNGAIVDENFRKACSFSVWDIGPEESYYVTTVFIKANADNEDDKIAARAEALKDCAIVCAQEINGPAAAKLVARHIHPMKTGNRIAVEEIIGKLQDVMMRSPAPWIRKAQYGNEYNQIKAAMSDMRQIDSILDATLADVLGRYPGAERLLHSSGFAWFGDEQNQIANLVLMKVREALEIMGICPDLFQIVMEEVTAMQRPLSH